jgi:streptogramin lyase
MVKKTRRRIDQKPFIETLEDRRLLSGTTWQDLLNRGIIGPTRGGSTGNGYVGPSLGDARQGFHPGVIIAHPNPRLPMLSGPAGYAPFQLQHAYGYDQLTFGGINTNYNNAGAGQTIAIIDAFDDPNISSDLQFFDNFFGITGASGNSNDLSFFSKVDQTGGTNYPSPDAGWALEISLDVEWAHAMAPSANILLVEANDNSFTNLNIATQFAEGASGVSVISMSFSGGEFAGELGFDSVYSQVPGHQGVSFVASTGDFGSPGGYPAISPNVLGAGGTTLMVDSNNNITSETGWSGSGGGVSPFEPQPAYQNGVVSAWSTTQRTNPDLSYDSDPNTGVSVYDTFGQPGWLQVGGTSAAAPQLSATIAIVNQDRVILHLPTLNTPGSNQTLNELYNVDRATPSDFHDITMGNNGEPATPGYDLVTGIGTPVANQLIPDWATINTTLAVTSANPAPHSFVTSQPNDFTIGFSDPYDPTTVAANELTVNGVAADSVTQPDASTLTFHFNTSPVAAQGPQTLAMLGGHLLRLRDGSPLRDYTETFYYAVTPLNVSSISPSAGSVIVLPTDLIVTFTAAVDPTTIGTGNLILSEGTVTAATPLTPTTVDYTVSGLAPDGSTLSVKLAANSIKDAFENPGPQSDFLASYQVNVPIQPFPTLTQFGVPGSLIYSGSTVGNTGFPGDTDSFTLSLDGSQTLSAFVTSDPGLRATIEVDRPDGRSIGRVTAASNGAMVALSGLSLGGPGTYKITVSGARNTVGNFALNVFLDAGLQGERFLGAGFDGTLASAQALNFRALADGSSRSALIGNIPLGTFAGDAFVSERGVGVQLVNGSTGVIEATFSDPSFAGGAINDIELGLNGDIFVGVDAAAPGSDGSNGEIIHFSSSGRFVGVVHLPNESATGIFFYPFGFDVAPDGTFWVAGPNSGSIIHADASGNLLNVYTVGGLPEWTAVRGDGKVYYSDTNASTINLLDPTTGSTSVFATDPFGTPLGVTVNPAGGIVVADPGAGILKYDGSGNLVLTIFDSDQPIDAQVDPSGNVLASTGGGFFSGPTLDKFDSSGHLIFSTPTGGVSIGLAVVGTDAPAPPIPQTVDYYSFTLTAGQVATVELNTYHGSGASIALFSSTATPLALGRTVDSTDQAINSFVAPAAATYYIRVSGNGVQYDLLVLKSADFSNLANTSIATAQLLVPDSSGNATVLGNVFAPVAPLYGIEWQQAAQQLIHSVDPQTGAFLTTFSSPPTTLTNPFGFNMATDGAFLYFNDGALFGDNTTFKINPSTGAVVSSFKISGAPPLFGLAYLNGFLYGTDTVNIFKIDPSNGAVLDTFAPGLDGNVTGIAGDPTRGVLWGVSQFHTLFEIDPASRTVIATAPDGLPNFEQDIGFQNNEIFVSKTNGSSSDIAVFDPTTFALKRDMPVNAQVISGLAADGVTSQTSFYRIDATAGDRLNISTTTPYGDPQFPLQPHNNLEPVIELYDANGNLVTSNDDGGTDGKNALIRFTATTTGAYYIRVLGENGSSGEYTLTVKHATGALPGFSVTATNPPAGAHVMPLASITVDFSDSILLSSLPTAQVTFGGQPATGFVVNNDHEVTWFLQSLPPGLNVPFTFRIAAGAVQDIHGVGLAAFQETIIVNTVPPRVVSASIHNGDVRRTGSLTLTFTFNEPINTTNFSLSSFDLHGIYRGTDYFADSATFNSTNTVLTLVYSNLLDDAYTITLFSGGIVDLTGYHLDGLGTGVPGSGDYVVHFALNDRQVPFPALSPVAPLGSLIYQGSTTEVIGSTGEADTFTLPIARNQTITIDLTTDGNLQGSVALFDPSGHLLGSFTASAVGGEALLDAIAVTARGTYKIVVSGANGTLGLYNLQVTLNAALELAAHGGGSDNTIGTAQSIDGTFIPLSGTASRGAVIGQNNQVSISPGDAFVSARFGGVQLVHNGTVIETFTDPSLSTGVIQDVKLGPNGDVYVGLDTNPGRGNGGEVLHFSPFGTLLGTVHLPNDNAGNFFYPFGFDIAPDGTIWVAAPNSGSIIHAAADGTLIRQYAVGGQPEWVAVRPSDGMILFSDVSAASNVDVLDPVAGTTSLFAHDPNGVPFGLRVTPSGNVLLADPNIGVLEFDPSGNLLLTVFDFGALESQVDPSGNILVANAAFGTLDEFDSNGNFLTFTFVSGTPIGLAVEGVDGPTPPPPAPSFYSLTLSAGQSTTFALTDIGGTGTATEMLVDGQGNVLATGTTVGTNVGQTMSFTAATTGTYYIEISGTQVEYSLVVTKNAAFDTEPNDSQPTAQALPPSNIVLGAIDNSTDADWYSFSASAGNRLMVGVTLPSQSGLSPTLQLFDPNGNLVASGTNQLTYTVPTGQGGVYSVEVTGASSTQGEYILRVKGATTGGHAHAVSSSLGALSGSSSISDSLTSEELMDWLPKTSKGVSMALSSGATLTTHSSNDAIRQVQTNSRRQASDALFTALGNRNRERGDLFSRLSGESEQQFARWFNS